MEATTQAQSGINLFGEETLSVEQMKNLSDQVNSSEASRIAFAEQVEQNMCKTGGKGCLAAGTGLFILGRDAEAIEKLQKGSDCKEKFMCLAFVLRRLGRYDDAIDNLNASAKQGADSLAVAMTSAILQAASAMDGASCRFGIRSPSSENRPRFTAKAPRRMAANRWSS